MATSLNSLVFLLAYGLILSALALSSADFLTDEFHKWMKEHQVSYGNEGEELKRFGIFKANYLFINESNYNPKIEFKLGLNKFADLTNEEFLAKFTGYTPRSTKPTSTPFRYADVTAPSSIDWRSQGAVTDVKDQGQCADYPYTAQDGTCDATKKSHYAASITGYEDVPSGNETALMNAVANQPVTVSIESSGLSFQFYSSGIYRGPCGLNLDHAVTAVGYGGDGPFGKYWIVKNSWGTTWGEQGYIRMWKDSGLPSGLCGIALQSSYPVA
ncbi:Cysteine protease [Rhynchospora pubera]|uniref:Cysteine protease n=1 Tax=Rhynchospora pubera TaxID=906938 RepID=A0AAV8F9K5_9POAL|nr:Cysteine protease [Rhynchospora pubera]